MYDHDMLTKRELLTKHRNDESSMCTVVYVIVHVCIRGIEEWAMYIIDSPLPVTGGSNSIKQHYTKLYWSTI